ncbi:hypothetical protein BZA05DRAFT_211362 [Tricharina praecox]|uniref:uncharacterized protein n=1 Tax=Tricharina praecox TaxID=43433 RepID=UPI00221EE0C0|nr:uncharacterized protein BZA05DRAFT_211362 [Tricharina praecox]KAI5841694.1 hypothetical protein BZA05DRAFT_211362 [Tricharina praecox]
MATANGSATRKGALTPSYPILTISPERCTEKLKAFSSRQKPGLLNLFSDSDFKNYGGKGAELVNSLISRGCPREMAEQFSVLVLYDVVILIDNSDSPEAENARRETLKTLLDAIVDVYELANDKGVVSVRCCNLHDQCTDHKDVRRSEVSGILETIKYGESAEVGGQLKKRILRPFVEHKTMIRPLLTIVITNGNPEAETKDVLKTAINNCLVKLSQDPTKTEDAVAFMFARVGGDQAGKELVKDLDNDQILGAWIDCLPVESRLKDFRPYGHRPYWDVLWKLMLGALYKVIDAMDDDSELDEDFLMPLVSSRPKARNQSRDNRIAVPSAGPPPKLPMLDAPHGVRPSAESRRRIPAPVEAPSPEVVPYPVSGELHNGSALKETHSSMRASQDSSHSINPPKDRDSEHNT